MRRKDVLANLRGVAKDKFRCNRGDAIDAPKCRFQVDALAKALLKLAHDGVVRAVEPVNGLPVVTDGEQLGGRRPIQ